MSGSLVLPLRFLTQGFLDPIIIQDNFMNILLLFLLKQVFKVFYKGSKCSTDSKLIRERALVRPRNPNSHSFSKGVSATQERSRFPQT